ncbi:MAG: glycosyltransferase, partial [Haloechinothrix sp.]
MLDESVRRFDGGRLLVGGSPLRVLRLSPAGARLLDSWVGGQPVGDSGGDGSLSRHLLDAGVLHPRPGPCTLSTDDVTLVVPVKDNAAEVGRVLEATGDLADRIVVDDGSAAPLLHATVRHPRPVGPAAARNTGWRLAQTELVAFLDSDTVPEPGWLDTILPLFADPQVAAVAPRISSALSLVSDCG